ncbi:MAG: DsbA family oxidoreductase [Pseudomonadota bacterium]
MAIVVEMVSDLVCPWCWLGLRRIQSAIALVPEIDVELLFRPYELDPTIPKEGVGYKDYMRHRMGGTGEPGEAPETSRFKAMREALEQYGAEESIPFRFSAITQRPNSFDAHRVVRWAQGQGVGAAVKEGLFSAYFEHGEDIGTPDILARVAGENGLDAEIVTNLLVSDADTGAVREEADLFREMGIAGVPTYVGDRRIAVQGAESAEKLAKFLHTLAAQQPAERPAAGTA